MAESGPGSGSDLYESKNLANFLMRFLIRMGVPSLMLIFLDSPHLEQCGSAAPLWKFHHSSQSQESDRLFLKDFGNSWTSQEEGPLHCLHRGQGQNHESGLWFRDWSLNNLEEFVLGVLVLAYGNYFLVFISYILMRCLSSIVHNESKIYDPAWGKVHGVLLCPLTATYPLAPVSWS